MLEPLHDRAICLVWRGKHQSPHIKDLPTQLEILWDGSFELRGEFFVVKTEHPEIGSRAIAGFPVAQLRPYLEATKSVARKVDEVFGQEDAVPLTPDVVEHLTKTGWDEKQLAIAARQGARYSPSRDSILFPPVVDG